MKKQILSLMAGALLICGFARADTPDSADALQKLYAEGNYKELIPKLNQVLALSGADAAQYDRYDLLVMKGEACLHTHAKSGAMDAFKAATAATKKPEKAAVALATSELIRLSSSNLTFTPKTKSGTGDKPAPIDIVDPDSRKQAFTARDLDLLATVKPKVNLAMTSTSLNEVVPLVTGNDMADLKAVEIASTGSSTDSKHMLDELGEHTVNLMNAALDQLTQRLDSDIDAFNNRLQRPKHGQQASPDVLNVPLFQQDVTSIKADALQISADAKSMSSIFDSTDMKPIIEASDAIQKRAAKNLEIARKTAY